MSKLQPTSLLKYPSSLATRMPCIGFGTWDSPATITKASCLSALKLGYRHIDTAQYYANEAEVGNAVAESGIPREDVYLTTKILSARGSVDKTYQACLKSIEILDPAAEKQGRKPYVDQFIIHNILGSIEQRKEVWAALERLYDEGRAKSIGVSNWGIGKIEEMKTYAKVWPPHANQVELHAWCQQRDLVEYCNKNEIGISAYAPLVRNREAHNEILVSMAKNHGKTTAQVLIRYCLQKGWAPLPKSDREERIKENLDVFDIELSGEEMERLDNVISDGEDDPVVQVANND
ncbi:MAG: hypothetical protein GOMPHAMPRED_007587 [Gomphillus americanus]|uniref:NADP-dependent oxidoreductase domain-containing protein n=1 Tax=Gomphillus americanus TaxID=1940652 RepID=A0A8H3IDR1_9LECA|nr:MAG: hypothetical protein GOMPHAMPRED_007587 [Gomphillus americanus]